MKFLFFCAFSLVMGMNLEGIEDFLLAKGAGHPEGTRKPTVNAARNEKFLEEKSRVFADSLGRENTGESQKKIDIHFPFSVQEVLYPENAASKTLYELSIEGQSSHLSASSGGAGAAGHARFVRLAFEATGRRGHFFAASYRQSGRGGMGDSLYGASAELGRWHGDLGLSAGFERQGAILGSSGRGLEVEGVSMAFLAASAAKKWGEWSFRGAARASAGISGAEGSQKQLLRLETRREVSEGKFARLGYRLESGEFSAGGKKSKQDETGFFLGLGSKF